MAGSELNVFYSDSVNAHFTTDSPSPRKPSLVVEDWINNKLNIRVVPPNPISKADFYLAHQKSFVDELFALQRDNGFFNRDECVLKSLPYTTGAMVSAAFYAVANRTFSCAPVSGFHHAMYECIGVYCTFNGLVVAAQLLARAGVVKKVGILDYDMHYGDGTNDIVNKLGLDFVVHYSAASEFRKPEHAARFVQSIPGCVGRMHECQVILYQAGADPHVNDPLGGWLTTDQLRERDKLVFSAARDLGIAVAWNLAGGYQEEKDGSIPRVLEIHRNTAIECIAHL